MYRFLQAQIHLSTALIVILSVTLAGVFLGMRYAHSTVHDYTVVLDVEARAPTELQYGVWPALTDMDFVTKVRTTFIAEQASFVEVNLTAMTLDVYKEGAPVLAVPVKSKGKEGSWWETPSGLYRAESKVKTHFSSFGKVYTPWNIPFQGNFFIHGWPYYPDGTPVAEGYSGGCIRLEDVYAEQVYALVEVGMPILVFEEEDGDDAFTYMLEAPDVRAQSYLVADLETNFALLASNAGSMHDTTVLPSMMTALVASEHRDIEKVTTVREDMVRGIETERLVVGGVYSLYDLLFPLLLEGSSEAVRVISSSFGHGRFAELLRLKADAIGMEETTFADAVYAHTGNTTSAEDMFLFLKYLHTNRPFILAMSAGTADTRAYGPHAFGDIASTHPFSGTEGFVGGGISTPTPHYAARPENPAAVALIFAPTSTAARGTASADLVTVLSLPFGGTYRNVAFIVLDSPDPGADTQALLTYAERMFK